MIRSPKGVRKIHDRPQSALGHSDASISFLRTTKGWSAFTLLRVIPRAIQDP